MEGACGGWMMKTRDLRKLWERTFSRLDSENFEPGLTYRAPETDKAREKTIARLLANANANEGIGAPNTKKSRHSLEPDEAFQETMTPQEASAQLHKQLFPEAVQEGYLLLNQIAEGGVGAIFRGQQLSLLREVAMKKTLEKEGVQNQFILEALITGSLQHPNIVPVHDLVLLEDSDEYALVMKLIDGVSWEALLHPDTPELEERTKDYDLEFHINILLQVCNAVAFSHSKNVCHNDLKPLNVMVGGFGEVYLMDWGLALDFSPEPQIDSFAPHRTSVSGTVFGTPSYMPPELASGQGSSIGPWTDVYLLGAILYEIVMGVTPHRGKSMANVLLSAHAASPPSFGDDVPQGIQSICTRAMARKPAERYSDVSAFQEELRDFLRRRESMLITEKAQETLQRCLDIAPTKEEGQSNKSLLDGQNQLYIDFAESVAGFRQAQVLWEGNQVAKHAEVKARIAFAESAVRTGDLGLAEAQLTILEADIPGVQELKDSIQSTKERIRREHRNSRLQRMALFLFAILIVLGLGVGVTLISMAIQKAQNSASIAQRRLSDIQRLSDARHLAEYKEKAETLWPAIPKQVKSMKKWLDKTGKLLKKLPSHRESLKQFRKKGKKKGSKWEFKTTVIQWEHDMLAKLVSDLERLKKNTVLDVKTRLELAKDIKKLTIEKHQKLWDNAIRSIANVRESPQYKGMRIRPQMGLIPLGKDPRSGLWEFAHYASGELPKRDRQSELVPSGHMGIVLVLLPGGAFRMGAQKPTEAQPLGQPNIDPFARKSEGPVHTVRLAPFFISKYEMTQGQWVRANGDNPSGYMPGRILGKRKHDLSHPVEQVKWKDAKKVLFRLGLTMPTEAQWEYAARGGTSSVWWTGAAKESLQGAANLADRYCKEHGGPGSWRYEMWLNDGYVVHSPVGRFRPNGFGLHDMAGNVWEWCMDRYGPYKLPVAPDDGLRLVEEKTPRVFRGGGFRASIVHARSADRYSLYAPEYSGYDVGIRPARVLD